MESLQNIFTSLESQAKKDGAQVELVVSNSESFSSNYNKGALNKYNFDTSVSAGVRVLYGKGAGFSTTEKVSKEALLETYKEALQSARDLHKEAKSDKAEQRLYKPSAPPQAMNLLHAGFDDLEIPEKLKIAETLERAALQFDSRVQNAPYSSYSENKTQHHLMSSLGFHLSQDMGGASATAYALAKEGEDAKGGFYTQFSRNPKAINAELIAQEAARRSVSLLGASQPKSGKYPVVLVNEATARLVSFINDHLSAKSLNEGTSLLKDRLGQKIFSDKITFVDDPFLTDLASARAYDSEGSPSQKITTIENGVLKSYLTNYYLSEKLNLPHTSHASRSGGEMGVHSTNTVMSLGEHDLQDLLSSYDQVILITAIDALHSGFKETSLDFSLPTYGFLYEKGQLVKPLHQMVLSGNLMSVLANVEKLSSRYNKTGGSVLAPDILIPEMSIAGN